MVFKPYSLYPYQGWSINKEISHLIMVLSDTCRLKWEVPMWELDQPFLARGSTPRNNQISIFKLHIVASGKRKRRFNFHALALWNYVYTFVGLAKNNKNCTFYLYLIFLCKSMWLPVQLHIFGSLTLWYHDKPMISTSIIYNNWFKL